MFRTADGQDIFVVDGHTHLWDGSPANQRNKNGRGWIDCFYAYHKNLSPADYVWPLEKYEKYGVETMNHDLFVKGYVDVAVLNSTYLKDFYINGFNTIEQNAVAKNSAPDRYILNGRFDPRDGELGLEDLRRQKGEYNITGAKIYTAEWQGNSKGWKMDSPESFVFFEECLKLGVTNIHVHKGPTVFPLTRDAFDVGDIDAPATEFQGLNFIIEHIGLPRLDDFCWIATQESNVYGGLAVAIPFMHTRPRYFAEMIANLLFWIGPDKILFGSDYAIWEPKWLIERFMAFELPEDLKQEFGVDLTMENKKKILGLNAARIYGIDPAQHAQKLQNDQFTQKASAARAAGQ